MKYSALVTLFYTTRPEFKIQYSFDKIEYRILPFLIHDNFLHDKLSNQPLIREDILSNYPLPQIRGKA